MQESIELEDSEEEETVTMTNIEKWSDCSSEYRDFDAWKIKEAGNLTYMETNLVVNLVAFWNSYFSFFRATLAASEFKIFVESAGNVYSKNLLGIKNAEIYADSEDRTLSHFL